MTHGGRHAGRPAVDRPADELRRRRPGRRRCRGRRAGARPVHFALPTRSPPTSLVTHAIVTYCSNERQRDELVEGQRRLAVDHAVDPQPPRGAVDDRREERGVDPVEAVVRDDDRRQAGDRGARSAPAAARRRPRTRAGSASLASAGRRRSSGRRTCGPTTPPASAATPIAEPVRSRFRRRQSGMPARGSAVSRAARGLHQPAHDLDPGDDRDPGTQRADGGRGQRQPQDREEADDRRRRRTRRPRSRTGPGRDSRAAPRSPARCPMTMISSASLSLVPNRATTKSFAPGGWRSMIVWPTAAISDDPGDSTPEISSLTPSATAAPISPANAPDPARSPGRSRGHQWSPWSWSCAYPAASR